MFLSDVRDVMACSLVYTDRAASRFRFDTSYVHVFPCDLIGILAYFPS
jgi:hypothetical protein